MMTREEVETDLNNDIYNTLLPWLGKMDGEIAQAAMRNSIKKIVKQAKAWGVQPVATSEVFFSVVDNEIVYTPFEWSWD